METTTLTAEAIRAMEAGRELDMLIQRHVFGSDDLRRLYVEHCQDGCVLCAPAVEGHDTDWCYMPGVPDSEYADDIYCVRIPDYSTEIAAAWEVVEKMGERGFYPLVKRPAAGMGSDKFWRAMFHDPREQDLTKIGVGVAESAPLAICRAALLSTL